MQEGASTTQECPQPAATPSLWRNGLSLALSIPAILLVLLKDALAGASFEYPILLLFLPFWVPGLGALLLGIPSLLIGKSKAVKCVAAVALILAAASLGRMAFLNIPLTNAARYGQVERAKTLLTLGANVNAKDGWGYTPVHGAAGRNDPEMIRLLLDRGADVNARSVPARNTPLIIAAAGSSCPLKAEVVELLLDRGAQAGSVGYYGSEGYTALQWAAHNGHLEGVRALLKRGIGPNERDGTHSALYHARQQGHMDVVEALLDAGAEAKGN